MSRASLSKASQTSRVYFSITCETRSLCASFTLRPFAIITSCPHALLKSSGTIKLIETQLCDALRDMNAGWGAGAETLKNIELLRESDCLAVVSGQQAGLFSGPLYTIYKALSAVKLAGCLTQRNTKSVPVFWIATEDHDFPEVARAEFIGRDCRLASVEASSQLHQENQPVGRVKLDDSIKTVVDQLLELLPVSEFQSDLESLAARCLGARTRLRRSLRAHDDIAR